MKFRTHFLLIIAFCLLTLKLAAAEDRSTSPLSDPVDSAARTALAAKNYRAVVDLYTPYIEGEVLTALAHYRYAIASKKLGLFSEANTSLKKAIAIAPNGEFASEPSRLAALQEQIAAGCSPIGLCDTGEPNEQAPEQPPEDTTLSAPVQTALSPTGVEGQEVGAEVEPQVHPKAHAAETSDPVETASSGTPTSYFPYWVKVAGAFVVCFLLLVFVVAGIDTLIYAYKRMRNMRRERKSPGEDAVSALCALGSQLIKVIGYTEAANSQSELHARLIEIEQLVAKEVGRLNYRHSGHEHTLTAADRSRLGELLELQSEPPDARVATPDQIEAAFRSAQWFPVFNRSSEGEHANV